MSSPAAALGYSMTSDSPGLANPNDQTLFETFLAYEDPTLAAAHEFHILGGYSWGVETDASDNESGIGPQDISLSVINGATLTELQGALDRSGFDGTNAWTVEAVDLSNYAPVPEPAVWLPASLGLVVLAAVRLVKRRADTRRTAHDLKARL